MRVKRKEKKKKHSRYNFFWTSERSSRDGSNFVAGEKSQRTAVIINPNILQLISSKFRSGVGNLATRLFCASAVAKRPGVFKTLVHGNAGKYFRQPLGGAVVLLREGGSKKKTWSPEYFQR